MIRYLIAHQKKTHTAVSFIMIKNKPQKCQHLLNRTLMVTVLIAVTVEYTHVENTSLITGTELCYVSGL